MYQFINKVICIDLYFGFTITKQSKDCEKYNIHMNSSLLCATASQLIAINQKV